MIRCLIVDDQDLMRTGFRLILRTQPDMEVVGEAADGLAGVEAAEELRPDVVLMDIRMPRLDGVAATPKVIAAVPGCRVLVLSMFDLDEYVVSALRAGAAGFLSKDVSAEELTAAVRTVHSGEAVVARRLLTRLIGTFVSGPATAVTSPGLDGLTERETQVLLLIARGRDNVEIAAELNVSVSTVKNYVTRLFAKLDVRDRAQAVILAYESGLVRASSPP